MESPARVWLSRPGEEGLGGGGPDWLFGEWTGTDVKISHLAVFAVRPFNNMHSLFAFGSVLFL